MKKPIIGITSAYEKDSELNNYFRSTVSLDYTTSVIMGGGIPIIIPVTENKEIIKEQLKLLDGLILSGGEDITPTFYNEDFEVGIGNVSPKRDICEIEILKEFLKTKKPILGICRGMQLINVYFGGTLIQNIKTDTVQHIQKFYPELETHKVKISEGNILYNIFEKEVLANSFHHQSIKKLGKGLEIIGKTNDGIVEAIYKKDYSFLYGIQWHPEMMVSRGNKKMKRLFDEFIKMCQ